MIDLEGQKDNTPPSAGRLFPLASICFHVVFAFVLSVSFFASAPAQEPDFSDIAPPPLRLLSKEEKFQLDAPNDIKKRTKLALELMEARMLRSEDLKKREMYDAMFIELGGFHGLMDNTLEFLDKSDKDSNKVLNNFKRFEIGLRRFTPRLEIMRRDLPLRYEHYPRTLIKYLREARAKAIAPLFDDTVLPNKKT